MLIKISVYSRGPLGVFIFYDGAVDRTVIKFTGPADLCHVQELLAKYPPEDYRLDIRTPLYSDTKAVTRLLHSLGILFAPHKIPSWF